MDADHLNVTNLYTGVPILLKQKHKYENFFFCSKNSNQFKLLFCTTNKIYYHRGLSNGITMVYI